MPNSKNSMAVAREIMTCDVGSVTPRAFISLTETFADSLHVRHIPVIDDNGHPIGIISNRDILAKMRQDTETQVLAGDLMAHPAITAHADTPVEDIAEMMKNYSISSVLVTENDKLIGIVSERDFLKLF